MKTGLTLPAAYFTSEEIYAEEREKIFGTSWFYIGRANRLAQPGDFFLAEVADESLIVTVGDDGQARAFFNVCRHRGTRLCAEPGGQFEHGKIRCPYHQWTYDCQGSLVAAPRMDEGRSFNRSEWSLLRAGLAEWEGFLFVNLAPEPEPITDSFAPHWNRLRTWRVSELQTAHRETYELKTNWKLIFHNFNECYHCLSIHPGLNDRSPVRSGTNDFIEGRFLGGPMNLTAESMTMSGARCAPLIRDLADDDHRRVYYYTLMPNMLLALHPDFVVAWQLQPTAPGRTTIHCDWLFEPETIAQPDFDPSDGVEFWDQTNRQDWEVCQRSYVGVRSRAYSPGPWAPNEVIPQAFDQELLRSMGHEQELPL